MPDEVPAIRILPMSDKIEGFRDRSIEDVQTSVFLLDLPACNGRFRYRSSGLNADRGTLVLFQFRARIIASALFVRDEPFERLRDGCAGAMHIDAASIRTFDALDVNAMRKIWLRFRAFGHVKQRLNPTVFEDFEKSLKNVQSPRVALSRPSAESSRQPKARTSRSANKPTARKRSP